MRCTAWIGAASGLIWLAGCGSAPSVAIHQAVGPAPAGQGKASGQGYLAVYSAREKEPLAGNIREWEWEYEMGDNALAYGLAHTGYIIRSENGSMLEYVRNARNPADPQPTVVTLPPGRYKVEAEAEETDGQTLTVELPVLIEPRKATIAHLSGHWKPAVHFTDAEVVRLPDGQIAGWLARQ